MRRPENARDAGAKRANRVLVVYVDLQVRSLLLKFGNAAATAMVTSATGWTSRARRPVAIPEAWS
jgi:hypothetical protein